MSEQKKKAAPETEKVETPKIPHVAYPLKPRSNTTNLAFYLIIAVFGIKAFIYGPQNFRAVNLRITRFVR